MLTIRLVSEMLYETAYKHVKFVREFVFSYLSARFRREFPLSCRPLWGYYTHQDFPHSQVLLNLPTWEKKTRRREEGRTPTKADSLLICFRCLKHLCWALFSSLISYFNVKHWGYVMKHSARLFSGNQLLTFFESSLVNKNVPRTFGELKSYSWDSARIIILKIFSLFACISYS